MFYWIIQIYKTENVWGTNQTNSRTLFVAYVNYKLDRITRMQMQLKQIFEATNNL